MLSLCYSLAMTGIGAPVTYVWRDLFKEFSRQPPTTLLKDWCEDQGLNYHNTSRHFAAFKRQIEERQRAKIQADLLDAAENAPAKLKGLLENEDPKIILAAANSILEKVGFTSQAATISIQQNNTNNIVVPPLFASAYGADAERMLGGKLGIISGEGTSGSVEDAGVVAPTNRGKVIEGRPTDE